MRYLGAGIADGPRQDIDTSDVARKDLARDRKAGWENDAGGKWPHSGCNWTDDGQAGIF